MRLLFWRLLLLDSLDEELKPVNLLNSLVVDSEADRFLPLRGCSASWGVKGGVGNACSGPGLETGGVPGVSSRPWRAGLDVKKNIIALDIYSVANDLAEYWTERDDLHDVQRLKIVVTLEVMGRDTGI